MVAADAEIDAVIAMAVAAVIAMAVAAVIAMAVAAVIAMAVAAVIAMAVAAVIAVVADSCSACRMILPAQSSGDLTPACTYVRLIGAVHRNPWSSTTQGVESRGYRMDDVNNLVRG